MEVLLLVLFLMGKAYARPEGQITDFTDIGEPSGSYLPSNTYEHPGSLDTYHQDHKHVYFYAAPDDEPPAHLRINVEPASHKHTKIIFVKAPSYGGIVPEVIAPPSLAEEKTLLYVLVKKQDRDGSITIPTSVGVKQAKPEVFFIKYHNKYDAKGAVSQGLAEQPTGAGLRDLGSPEAFVQTLDEPQKDPNLNPDIDVRFG